jgi:stearoyl-CoA desaturase (delta-9 desaturase)
MAARHWAIQYPPLVFLSIVYVLALASFPYIYFYGTNAWEVLYHVAAYLLGGFGITALYHRAWAHNAVRFTKPVEYIFATFSTLVLQMPARQWISTHLKHHHHTDHQEDPHNIKRGFWWAHFEWIILAPVPPIELPERLTKNPILFWQERYYWPLSAFFNVVIPVVLSVYAGLPWWGGLLVSGLRLVITSHLIYSVNSICHVWGSRPFTKDVSARDVWWFPFVLGEQYHNYHHAFPRDYRHGIGRYDFDPTKWLINLLVRVGLARNLFAMHDKRIEETRRRAVSSEE